NIKQMTRATVRPRGCVSASMIASPEALEELPAPMYWRPLSDARSFLDDPRVSSRIAWPRRQYPPRTPTKDRRCGRPYSCLGPVLACNSRGWQRVGEFTAGMQMRFVPGERDRDDW